MQKGIILGCKNRSNVGMDTITLASCARGKGVRFNRFRLLGWDRGSFVLVVVVGDLVSVAV
jgi:hypothetical protein